MLCALAGVVGAGADAPQPPDLVLIAPRHHFDEGRQPLGRPELLVELPRPLAQYGLRIFPESCAESFREHALYGFDPTSFLGVYMPDTFWFKEA